MAKWEKIQINATTMDKFCCNNNIMPDFIKMDIEGAEMPALEGLKQYKSADLSLQSQFIIQMKIS